MPVAKSVPVTLQIMANSLAVHSTTSTVLTSFLPQDFIEFNMLKMDRSQDPDFLAAMGMEIHGISSSGKPLTSWTAQAACQEGREACGGHGFLKCSRFGEIRADNDANCTYEGELLKPVKRLEVNGWLANIRSDQLSSSCSTVKCNPRKLLCEYFRPLLILNINI